MTKLRAELIFIPADEDCDDRRRPFHQIRPRVAADGAAYGPQISSKIRLSLPAERADAQGRRFVGYFNADCQCSGSLAWATKI
jgi:hypothetical protein